MSHAERIADLTTRFDEAMARFTSRVTTPASEAAEREPAGGGWSVAQIACHVGIVNETFAGLIDGSVDRAMPAPEGYVETPWSELRVKAPDKIDAPERFVPPAGVSQATALAQLFASGNHIRTALAGLRPDDASWVLPSMFGVITRYQVGEWAVAHVIRHNAQAKRALGS